MTNHHDLRRGDRQRRNDCGATVVEFALVLPVMLAVIGLVFSAGYLGIVRVIVDHSAREGVRAATVPSSADLRSYPSLASITATVDDASPLVTPTAVSVSGIADRNHNVIVIVSYTFTNPGAVLLAPLSILGLTPVSDTLTLTKTVESRRE